MIRTDFIDINAILSETVKRIQVPENIKIDLNLVSGLPKVKCYSFDIVARNLIRNAIDAMPNGGCLRISSKLISYLEIENKKIEIRVEDTGKGIPKDVIPNIFDINFTTKKEKEGKGLGFGLWWVKKFVIRIKGDICVQSREREGTTFTIKLPIS